jgi:Flp pilus assembly protein TadD
MLLELGRPADALKEFETAMKQEPNRFRVLYGAARAAEATGDRRKARDYSRTLLEICQRADKPGRPELQEVRKFGD